MHTPRREPRQHVRSSQTKDYFCFFFCFFFSILVLSCRLKHGAVRLWAPWEREAIRKQRVHRPNLFFYLREECNDKERNRVDSADHLDRRNKLARWQIHQYRHIIANGRNWKMRDCSRNTYRARKAIEKLLSARLKYIYKPPSPLVCLFMSVINKRRPPRGDLNKDFLSFVPLPRRFFPSEWKKKQETHGKSRRRVVLCR